MKTLAEKAIETYEELNKVRDAEQAEREAAEKGRRLEEARNYYRDVFKEEPVIGEGGVFLVNVGGYVEETPPEENPYFPHLGLSFGCKHGNHFNILGKCNRCGQFVSVGEVRSLYDLGYYLYYLKNWSIPYHECSGMEI